MPKFSICSFVNKLPQIFVAVSMPSEASDAASIEKEHSQIEKGRALLSVLSEATKLTGIHASQSQSVIAHIRLKLQEVVFCMEMVNHF